MADLLSLFRGNKPSRSQSKTTTPSPVVPVQAAPERSGAPPNFGVGSGYEVVVPVPAPVVTTTPTNSPGSNGGTTLTPTGQPYVGPNDTSGYYFDQVVSASAVAPAPTRAAVFYLLAATTSPKETVDGPVVDRLYRLFTKGQA